MEPKDPLIMKVERERHEEDGDFPQDKCETQLMEYNMIEYISS